MKIIIEYDGATAKCTLLGCLPTAQDPNVNPFVAYNFNDADRFSQIRALEAFDTIKQHWKRERKHEK